MSDPSEIVEYFNKYFENFGIDREPNTEHMTSNMICNEVESSFNSIFLFPTKENEVKKVILNLSKTNSIDFDNISTEILKLVA